MTANRPSLALSTLLALVLALGTAVPAQAQLGVAGGLNFESAGDIETSTASNATVDNATGYHVGVVYDLGLGPLNLRPGLFYRDLGTEFEFPDSRGDVAAWEVPVDIRISVLPLPLVNPYILGGPKASFYRSDVDEFDDALEEVTYSFTLGVGASLSLGSTLTLQPELRYDFGATDYVSDDFEIGGTDFSPEDPKLSSFALRLNVLF